MTGEIRTLEVSRCILCGAQGRELYSGLRDRLFTVPGVWAIAQCPVESCGLLWLNPTPTLEDVRLVYETYYTHVAEPPRGGLLYQLFAAAKRGYVANRFGYAATAMQKMLGLLPWIYPGRAAELDFSVMWLEAGRGRLLDVGAGSGWLVEHMNTLGWEAEGVDFDLRAVQSASARGLKISSGGLHDQRFPEGSFDAITMSHSIEHVHDPVGWLAEARRILRPGGRLAIATPNTRSLLHRRFRQHWFSLEPPRHLHLYNRAALESALRKSGFERFRLFTSARDAPGVFLGSRSIRRTARFDMMAPQPPVKRLLARAVQLAEIGRLVSDPDAGEDLIALAQRES